MQPILDQIDEIIRPALREYATAERALTDANETTDQAAIGAARALVMRKARNAANELHHLADFVLNNPAPGMPAVTNTMSISSMHPDGDSLRAWRCG